MNSEFTEIFLIVLRNEKRLWLPKMIFIFVWASYFETNDIAQNNDSLKKITFSFSIFHFISFLKQWYGSLKNRRKFFWKRDKLGQKSRFFFLRLGAKMRFFFGPRKDSLIIIIFGLRKKCLIALFFVLFALFFRY